MIDLNGYWIGYYTYGSGYSEWDKLRVVPFNVTIRVGIYQFIGRLTEEVNYGGIDDEIAILGRLQADEIEFTKYYSRRHVLSENNKIITLESNNSNIVYYKGKYD